MPSASQLADSKGGGSKNLLRGSDLPTKMREVTVRVLEAREAPEGFNSPLILDLDGEPIPGKSAVPLNITNTRALAQLLGDDYSKWAGSQVTFAKIPSRNPQTGAQTWGLRVVEAKPSKGKAKKVNRPVSTTNTDSDDEVPF